MEVQCECGLQHPPEDSPFTGNDLRTSGERARPASNAKGAKNGYRTAVACGGISLFIQKASFACGELCALNLMCMPYLPISIVWFLDFVDREPEVIPVELQRGAITPTDM